jgi:hypothetical protein
MSFLGSFDYTTGKTWGGAQISPTALQASSLLGGFFGLDHLLLRSPKTAVLKFVANILTLGLWYWYDVIQVFLDTDFVKQYGYSLPIVGPVGLGAGIVGNTEGPGAAPPGTPSPWFFVAYFCLLFIPYGVSHFIAGDFYGGSAQFLLTFILYTTLLGLIWNVYTVYYSFFKTESLVTEGTERFFPATLFMKPTGPAPNLIPPKLAQAESLQNKEKGLFDWICDFLLGSVEKPILETVVKVGDPVVQAAETVKESAENAAKQTGGALQMVGGGADSVSKYIFLATTALIFVGSVGMTYIRFWRAKKNESSQHSIKDDIPPEEQTNDTPPGPGVL